MQVSRAIRPQHFWVKGSEEPRSFTSRSGKIPHPVARPTGPLPEAHGGAGTSLSREGPRGSHGKIERMALRGSSSEWQILQNKSGFPKRWLRWCDQEGL